jgi:hypothetical protein
MDTARELGLNTRQLTLVVIVIYLVNLQSRNPLASAAKDREGHGGGQQKLVRASTLVPQSNAMLLCYAMLCYAKPAPPSHR